MKGNVLPFSAPLRVIAAPDKFKGTLTASQAAEAIGRGCRAAGADVDLVPVADGGEGTLNAFLSARDGSLTELRVEDPLGRPIVAPFARLTDGTAVVELARASGLSLVTESERDPLRATTSGTGRLIRGALDTEPSRIVIAIGGSATVDCGTGLAHALGVRFYDAKGDDVPPGGLHLSRIDRVDQSSLDARLPETDLIVASDVLSPLTGPDGAARVFGPQKGATHEVVAHLEDGLSHLGTILERDFGVRVLTTPGAGAAGGVGAMLMALGAHLRSGAELITEMIGFHERVGVSDLVITGEGKLDESSMAGKAPVTIARLCRDAGVPCIALVGVAELELEIFTGIGTLIDYFDGDTSAARLHAAEGLEVLAKEAVGNLNR